MGHAVTKRLPKKPSTYALRVVQALRIKRTEADLTVTEMAEAITECGYSLSRAAYSHYELGRRPFPLEMVPYVVMALGIEVTDLLPSG